MTETHRKNLHWACLLMLGTLTLTLHAGQQWQPRGPAQDLGTLRQELLAAIPAVEAYNVLIITVDSLRPDALGCYGAISSKPSPQIDQLAKDSFLFESAFAVSPDPDVALLGLTSSLFPSALRKGMSAICPSIASVFANHNFNARGILSPVLLERLKERLSPVDETLGLGRRISQTAYAGAIPSIAARTFSGGGNRSLFLHVHLDSTRAPATNHPGFDFGSKPEDHYRGAVRWIDQSVGQILDALKKANEDQRTIVILTAPSPGSRGRNGAAEPLADDRLRVPLLIRVPGLTPRKIAALVSTIDIAPTLATLYGIAPGYSFQGRSFLNALLKNVPTGRVVYSEELSPRLEGSLLLSSSVRDANWRLIDRGAQKRRLLNKAGVVATDSERDKAPLAALSTMLEETAVYAVACNKAWARGDEAQPDISGAEGLLARTEWLIGSRDPRGRESLLSLIKASSSLSPLHMELLLQVGTLDDVAIAKNALSSTDSEVRALSGAFLLLHENREGLAQIIAGLNSNTREHRQVILLDRLGATRDSELAKSVLAFEPEGPRAEAARTLALVRLGHADSETALIRHILDPNGLYEKAPFIDACVETFPKRAIGVLSLSLTDGDARADTLLSVLGHVEALNASTLEEGVSLAVEHENQHVREKAIELLHSWRSLSGTQSLLHLAEASPKMAGWAAKQFLSMPALIGSPCVPGLRLDVLSTGAQQQKLKNGLLPLDWNGLRFAFQFEAGRTANHAVVAFRKTAHGFEKKDIALMLNARRISSGSMQIETHGDHLLVIAPLEEGQVEKGANRVHLRAGPEAGGPVPTAFFILTGGDRFQAQGGAERTDEKELILPLKLNRDLRVFKLWAQSVGSVSPSQRATRVQVLSSQGCLTTIHLPRGGGSLTRTLSLPTKVWRLRDLRIRMDGGSKEQRAAAVVVGTR